MYQPIINIIYRTFRIYRWTEKILTVNWSVIKWAIPHVKRIFVNYTIDTFGCAWFENTSVLYHTEFRNRSIILIYQPVLARSLKYYFTYFYYFYSNRIITFYSSVMTFCNYIGYLIWSYCLMFYNSNKVFFRDVAIISSIYNI